MRQLLSLILIMCFFSSRAQNIDVLHYDLSIILTDYDDSLIGRAEIRLINKQASDKIELDLKNVSSSKKGMILNFAEARYQQKQANKFIHKGNKLVLQTPDIKQGDSVSIIINYRGIPADGLVISKNKFGDRTFFSDNWPDRASHWFPCNDKPSDKASFKFSILAPQHYSVISNGILQNEKAVNDGMKLTVWEETIPQPTKVMVIGVAKFATKTYADSPPNVPISAWVYPQDSAKGFSDYALTPGIVKFFSNYIAPFPYNKLANVQSKTIFGGMENASCIFYAENSVTGDGSEEDLMAHEIAHQWFGDMVSEKSFAHLWLSEGFATYMTDLYFEHKYGKEAMIKRLQKERAEAIAFAKTSTHAVVDSITDLMSLLNANSYQKGAWVLHMLRNEVGDTVFQKIIQTYYNQYKGSNAETRDFEAVAEKVSGKDLKWFFDQWLYQGGIPKLEIKWYYDSRKQAVVLKYNTPGGGKFSYKIPIVFNYKDGAAEFIPTGLEVRAIAWQTTTEFETKRKPVSIVLDPDTTLLFEASITEIKQP